MVPNYRTVKGKVAALVTLGASVLCAMPAKRWKAIAAELRPLVNHGTQKELARDLGITPASLSRYLDGKRKPDPGIAADLAARLGRDINELAGVTKKAAAVTGISGRRPVGPSTPVELARQLSLISEELRRYGEHDSGDEQDEEKRGPRS